MELFQQHYTEWSAILYQQKGLIQFQIKISWKTVFDISADMFDLRNIWK